MRIGILTFHCAHNYGAMLQCYALQEYLVAQGHEVSVVDYRPDYLTHGYVRHALHHWISRNPLRAVKRLLTEPFLYRTRGKRWDGFDRFMRTKLHLTPYHPASDYVNFDLIIVGSDQIWSTRLTGEKFDPVFFGKGLACRSVSYAASMSPCCLSADERKALPELLRNLDALSVREAELAEMIRPLTEKEVRVVCDPVLLLTYEEWERRCIPVKRNRPYVLCYNLMRSEACMKQARETGKELGCEVVDITAILRLTKPGKYCLQALDPISFISYFKEATFVVTSSFHGTVFSVLFHKPFYVVGMGNLGGRSAALLERLELKDRLLEQTSGRASLKIDYAKVDRLLAEFRKEAVKYLDNIERL